MDQGLKTADNEREHGGLIVREHDPLNLESPFNALDGIITPNSQFFVRSHFSIPNIDVPGWQLSCGGHVARDIVISYEELVKLPSRTLTSTMECAGNGRVFLTPKADGVQWERGGIGTAEWTGVSLSVLLEKAGLKAGALEVVLSGADEGELIEPPKTPGRIRFSRSLPLSKALSDEVILAFLMNGEPLGSQHGFPVRAIVPGWYGMASVKWLEQIEVVDQPFQGYWQTAEYSQWKRLAGEPVSAPVAEMQTKSQIARPGRNERITPGTRYRIFGAAWSGEANIAQVDVSTDGGKRWSAAHLLGEQLPFTWRLWEFEWQVPSKPGRYELMSRATDDSGTIQPSKHSPDHNAYMIHHTLPLDIEVR